MPRTPEQNKKIKDKRREKIMAVALRLFAVEGYDAITVDDITTQAKCSHGLFYHYFDSKDDIFSSILKESAIIGTAMPPFEEAMKVGGVKGLKLLTDYLEYAANTKDDAVMYYAEIYVTMHMQQTLDRHADFAKNTIEPMHYIKTLIAQGQKEGKVINGDPQHIALAFYDFIIGSIIARVTMGKKNFVVVPADVILEMLLKGPLE
jgi:AcrR family transcriptional regulator